MITHMFSGDESKPVLVSNFAAISAPAVQSISGSTFTLEKGKKHFVSAGDTLSSLEPHRHSRNETGKMMGGRSRCIVPTSSCCFLKLSPARLISFLLQSSSNRCREPCDIRSSNQVTLRQYRQEIRPRIVHGFALSPLECAGYLDFFRGFLATVSKCSRKRYYVLWPFVNDVPFS